MHTRRNAIGLAVSLATVRAAQASPASTPADVRLSGVWRSDKAKTIQRWKYWDGTSTTDEETLKNWFGRTTLRFTATHVEVDIDGEKHSKLCRTVASDARSVVVEFTEENERSLHQLYFAGEHLYFISMAQGVEYFRRVEA